MPNPRAGRGPLGLLRRHAARADPRLVALADELPGRRTHVAVADRAVAAAEARGEDDLVLAPLRRALDDGLTSAYDAADAAYLVALGPVEGLKRVTYLARLQRPAVREADDVRRQIALARSHARMASRDEIGLFPPASVPPSVGTHASVLGTHEH